MCHLILLTTSLQHKNKNKNKNKKKREKRKTHIYPNGFNFFSIQFKKLIKIRKILDIP